MSSAQGTTALERAERRGTTFAALFFGVPLAAGFLALFCFDKSPLHYLPQSRYFHNPVEWVEVVLFCCALSALGTKLWRHFWEGRAAGIKPRPLGTENRLRRAKRHHCSDTSATSLSVYAIRSSDGALSLRWISFASVAPPMVWTINSAH